jgi:hypothetical protein
LGFGDAGFDVVVVGIVEVVGGAAGAELELELVLLELLELPQPASGTAAAATAAAIMRVRFVIRWLLARSARPRTRAITPRRRGARRLNSVVGVL